MQVEPLLLHGDVAVLVGRGATNDADVDGEGLVEEHLMALELHQLHERLRGPLVHPAALQAGVDERVQTHRGQEARAAGGDLPHQQ